MQPAAIAERAVGTDTIYTVSDTTSEETPPIEVGVVQDSLVVGVGSGVDQFVAPGATLADDPQYQAVMAELPDAYNHVTYVNTGQLIEVLGALLNSLIAELSEDGATPVDTTGAGPQAIRALASVGYQNETGVGISVLLYIEG
jgi:hypothetical protein